MSIQSLLPDVYEATDRWVPSVASKFDAPFIPTVSINYVFFSKQFSVLKYGPLTDIKEQRYLLDHLPILTKLVQK